MKLKPESPKQDWKSLNPFQAALPGAARFVFECRIENNIYRQVSKNVPLEIKEMARFNPSSKMQRTF